MHRGAFTNEESGVVVADPVRRPTLQFGDAGGRGVGGPPPPVVPGALAMNAFHVRPVKTAGPRRGRALAPWVVLAAALGGAGALAAVAWQHLEAAETEAARASADARKLRQR